MRTVAYLLMALATMAGSISAATAYLVPLDAGVSDERLASIRVSDPAGLFDPTTDEGQALKARLDALRAAQRAAREAERPEPLMERQAIQVETPPLPEVEAAPTGTQEVRARVTHAPIARPGDDLSEEMLSILRDQGVTHVRSASFQPGIWFRTWPSWVFLASMAVLFGSAMLVRAASRKAVKAAPDAGADRSTIPDGASAIAAAIHREVDAIVADLRRTASEHDRLVLIVARLGEAQRTLLPAFVAARPALIEQFGMAGFAHVMDRFAAMERQINRAWSAAADGVLGEAEDSLATASVLCGEVEATMRR